MDLSARLRILRDKLSQAEFGKRLGLSQTSIGNYENGSRSPDAKTIIVICKTFGVRPEWLLLGEGPMRTEENTNVMADMSAIPTPSSLTQPIEKKGFIEQKAADMSAIAPLYEENRSLYQKNMELQERLLKVSEDKAELQVALERASMNIERRDQRIRELEKENAGLREERKGAALVCRTATRDAG